MSLWYGASAEVCRCAATRKGEPSAPGPAAVWAASPWASCPSDRLQALTTRAPRAGVRSPIAGQQAWRQGQLSRGCSPARAGAQVKRQSPALHACPQPRGGQLQPAGQPPPRGRSQRPKGRGGRSRGRSQRAAEGPGPGHMFCAASAAPRRWTAAAGGPAVHHGVAGRRAAAQAGRRSGVRRASAPAAGWSAGLGQPTTTAGGTLRREGGRTSSAAAADMEAYATGWPVRRRSHGAIHAIWRRPFVRFFCNVFFHRDARYIDRAKPRIADRQPTGQKKPIDRESRAAKRFAWQALRRRSWWQLARRRFQSAGSGSVLDGADHWWQPG